MECTLGQFCIVKNLRSVKKVPFSAEFHPSKLESRVKLSQGKPRDLSRCNFQIVEITKILTDISLIPWSSLLSREVKKNPKNSLTSIHCMLVCLEQILFKLELFDWAMLSLSKKVMGIESFTFCYPQVSNFCLLWKYYILYRREY